MRSFDVAFAAAVLASLLVADSVSAQSRDKPKPAAAQGTQGTQGAYEEAWTACQAQFAGNRGFLGRDRYAYIEQCFHDKTGKFPGQVGMNCQLRRC
jgi:hypothetical protein